MAHSVLRQYALLVLFIPPPPSWDGTLDNTAAPVHTPFPFVHKPNTFDDHRIVMPVGWDSWDLAARGGVEGDKSDLLSARDESSRCWTTGFVVDVATRTRAGSYGRSGRWGFAVAGSGAGCAEALHAGTSKEEHTRLSHARSRRRFAVSGAAALLGGP